VTYIDLAAYDSIDYRILDAIAAKGHAVRIFAEKVKKMRDKKSLKEALNSL